MNCRRFSASTEDNGPLIRVGYGKHASAAEVVQQCVAALAGAAPLMLLVFCGGKHDPDAITAQLRALFGPVPVVGGSAAGAVSRDGYGYSGFELGIAAFCSPTVTPRLFANYGLLEDEHDAGRDLGARVASECADGSVTLLLFDSVASVAPIRLHPASTIVRGFHEGLGDRRVTLFGGGLLTDMNLSDGWVFDGDHACKHAVVALVFPPEISAETVILHGCRPVSTFMEITRLDGAEVYELDGRPALGVIERMLGLPLGGATGGDLSLIATLGEKQGDPFAPYDENAYVNRLILRANRETGSITLFEPDFRLGTRVQIMGRDNALMLESVRHGVVALNRALRGRNCLLGLYIDCAGRASARSGASEEEAALAREGLATTIPLLGFYSGVEVAPFAGYSRPLDWTAVLTVLCRTP